MGNLEVPIDALPWIVRRAAGKAVDNAVFDAVEGVVFDAVYMVVRWAVADALRVALAEQEDSDQSKLQGFLFSLNSMNNKRATNVVGHINFLYTYKAVSEVVHWEVMEAAWKDLNGALSLSTFDHVKDATHDPEPSGLQDFLKCSEDLCII